MKRYGAVLLLKYDAVCLRVIARPCAAKIFLANQPCAPVHAVRRAWRRFVCCIIQATKDSCMNMDVRIGVEIIEKALRSVQYGSIYVVGVHAMCCTALLTPEGNATIPPWSARYRPTRYIPKRYSPARYSSAWYRSIAPVTLKSRNRVVTPFAGPMRNETFGGGDVFATAAAGTRGGRVVVFSLRVLATMPSS